MINPGSRIGSYEVGTLIGEGGMGRVYRARDARLQRDVALKVLPEHLAANPDRIARFQREAQALATLNHPNIAQIYGVEESDNTRCLVLELVDGETLAERLVRGPIPLSESLVIAKQIAEALEAAHERGVIHRDLKPANIKITSAGKVKVLDFGLARMFETSSAESLANSPTVMSGSIPGVILGTAAYMSPEQARARQVDKRSDIWSFGCVLFEMLTAQQLFGGETVSDSIAKTLQAEPDFDLLPAVTPSAIRKLLKRCLRKDAGVRLHDIADARIEIEEAITAEPAPPIVHADSRRQASAVLLIATLLLVLGIVVVVAVSNRSRVAQAPLMQFPIAVPMETRLDGDYRSIALSADGTKLAYVAFANGVRRVFMKPIDRLDATPLPGTDGAKGPVFSPDGNWIAFTREDGFLGKVPVAGGAVVEMFKRAEGLGNITWAPDGIWVSIEKGVTRLSEGSGSLEMVLPVTSDAVAYNSLQVLPDGKHLLVTAFRTDNFQDGRVDIYSLDSRQTTTVLSQAQAANVVGNHLVYARGTSLMSVGFDPVGMKTTGTPVLIGDDIRLAGYSGSVQFAASANGTVAYVQGSFDNIHRQLVWVDMKGNETPLSLEGRAFIDVTLSPNGARVAASVEAFNQDVWFHDIPSGPLVRFTTDSNVDQAPLWSVDNQRLSFRRGNDLVEISVNDPLKVDTLLSDAMTKWPTSWTPDGTSLIFMRQGSVGFEIWTLDRATRQAALLIGGDSKGQGTVSPDGKWIAYLSLESGHPEVFVQKFPGLGSKRQISVDGGDYPAWAHDGKSLFFRSGSRMMVARIDNNGTFSVSKLFEGDYGSGGAVRNYAVAPDGRFLMVKNDPKAAINNRINIVLNGIR